MEPEYTSEDVAAAAEEARAEGYDAGLDDGYESGYKSGYSDGYDDGCVYGRDGAIENIEYVVDDFFKSFDPDDYLNADKSAIDPTLLRDALNEHIRINR